MADYQPDMNASLGLIFRMNALWEKADRKALTGNLDEWELILDRIFSNLLYRNEMEIEEDENGNIKSVKISEKDVGIWKFIKQEIRRAKLDKLKTFKSGKVLEIRIAKENHYQAVIMYDIYLRKFMQSLGGLYLKETESNPSKALFGGAFKRKEYKP